MNNDTDETTKEFLKDIDSSENPFIKASEEAAAEFLEAERGECEADCDCKTPEPDLHEIALKEIENDTIVDLTADGLKL